jgi:hypothetical protein
MGQFTLLNAINLPGDEMIFVTLVVMGLLALLCDTI